MRRGTALYGRAVRAQVLALAGLLSCAGPRPNVSPPAPAHARRAVLLSFDGLSGTRLARLLGESGKLPARGFATLVERGFFAVRSVPVTPSLTPAAHAAHVTGALPRDSGIVGNYLLDPAKPFGTRRSGFDTPLRAETLCEAAARQGRRVGVLSYPHAAGTPRSGCSSFGTNWVSDPLTSPRMAHIPAADWTAAENLDGSSFSPAEIVTLTFSPTAHRLRIVALDSTDDGRRNYDRLRIEPEGRAAVIVGPGEWFPFSVRGRTGLAGAWCKLLSLAPDLSSAEIYLGGIWETDAYPEEFRRSVDAQAGFWPGRADRRVFGARSAHPEIYLEQSDRLAEFLERTHRAAIARSDWDLLFLYTSEVDAVEHEFLLTDPRQAGYTPERSARFAAFVDHAYATADAGLNRIERALAPEDALFVTSDHGMTPVWNEISIDEILRQEGYLRLTPEGKIDPGSAAVAMASSGIAHVSINPAEPLETLGRVRRVLEGFRIAGDSPWDRVATRAEAGYLGLDAPESGDLILLAKPGNLLSMDVHPGRQTSPPDEYGAHGYRAAFPDLDATLLASGPGVSRGRKEQIQSTEIAGLVAKALGIEPPRSARK